MRQRRYTCSIIGRPQIGASGLPGNLVEPMRAGMMQTVLNSTFLEPKYCDTGSIHDVRMRIMKAQLWNVLRSAVRLSPERLRLAFLEQPLTVPMDFGGIKITAHSSEEYYIRAGSAAKEPETVGWLLDMPKHAVFVDVGANIGAYSLIAAQLYPEVRILAIEPSAPTFASLCHNIWINRLHERITPVCAALGRTNGPCAFSYSSWQPGAALHGLGQEGQHWQLSFKIDDLVGSLRSQHLTPLKIDRDAAEQAWLAGATAPL